MTPRHIRIMVCAALFCFACAGTRVAAQDSRKVADRYLVSAKAGVVNLVEGRAEVRGAGRWHTATVKDAMRSGDAARTGADGRLEILLTPGSFLRLGANAEAEMTDTSLERLAIRLLRGSAIVEAVDAGDDAPVVTITTPHTAVAIVRGGVYRVEADTTASEIVVHKGRALVGGASLLVKDKRKTVVAANGTATVPVKFDKKERDDFDLWSRERAELLARDNRRLSQRALSTTLASFSSFNDPFFTGNNRSGLWIFNERSGGHTFLPFGWGVRSPYGCNYNTGMMPGNQHTGFNPIVGNRPPYTPNEGGGQIGVNPGGGNNNPGNTPGNSGVAQPSNPMPREPVHRDIPRDMPREHSQPRMGREHPVNQQVVDHR